MPERVMGYSTIVSLQSNEDGMYYVARHPEIEECLSEGATPEEALTNLEEVTGMILAHLREHSLPVPQPRGLFAVPQAINEKSQTAVRATGPKQARVDLQPVPA